MKANYTHVIFVLDESGSMVMLTDATIEGVNSLVATQKAAAGDFTTAVYKFNNLVKEVDTFDKLSRENYRPCGGTALIDAVCTAIDTEGKRLAAMNENDRPGKVVVVVVTDGQENSSHKFTMDDMKAAVKLQQDTYSWQFVFLGANIDAFAVGGSYGFAQRSTMQYTPTYAGVVESYNAVSGTLANFRAGEIMSMDFGQNDVH